MSFKFINAAATGTFQSLFNRLVENPETVNLTDDTPGANSAQSLPFDGIDDSISFNNIILLEDIGVSGLSAENIAFDGWVKRNTATGSLRTTFFDTSIMRSQSATTSGFDGFYVGAIITTGTPSAHYIEFRVNHNAIFSYVLTSDASINTTDWHHIYCEFASGAQEMSIYQDMTSTSLSSVKTVALSSALTAAPLGARTVSFGGRLDELRLWLGTGTTTSITQLAAVSSIGVAPEDMSPNLNDFKPSADVFAAWWRFDTVSAVQLFSAISGSILDSTSNSHVGTPSGFQGSDIVSSEITIINGLSASGDLVDLLGGSLDHGGLMCVDPGDDTLSVEMGSENLINEANNSWSTTGAGVVITQEDNNIFYGSSGIKINTGSADTGAFQEISNSALLFDGNTYTCSLRYRSISGSTSARVTFTLGNSVSSITAVTNTNTWRPIVLRNTLRGTATGRIDMVNLNAANNAGALWHVDGFQVIEGDYPSAFIGHSRMRKTGQLNWAILD